MQDVVSTRLPLGLSCEVCRTGWWLLRLRFRWSPDMAFPGFISAIRLPCVSWPRMRSLNRGFEGGEAGGPLFSPAFTRLPESSFLSSRGSRLHSLRRIPADPHCRNTCRHSRRRSDGWLVLADASVNSRRFANYPAGVLDSSSFKAWFKASFWARSPPIKRCCFNSWSRNPSMKAWAVCLNNGDRKPDKSTVVVLTSIFSAPCPALHSFNLPYYLQCRLHISLSHFWHQM